MAIKINETISIQRCFEPEFGFNPVDPVVKPRDDRDFEKDDVVFKICNGLLDIKKASKNLALIDF